MPCAEADQGGQPKVEKTAVNEVDKPFDVTAENGEPKPSIRFAYRLGLLVTAWLGVFAVLGAPGGLFLAFPLGLFRAFGIDAGMRGDDFMSLGWVLYGALCVALLVVSQRRAFLILFAVLCVLLSLNIGGCLLMINEFGRGGL